MIPYNKNILRCIASALTLSLVDADTIAYWDQNNNGLPGGSFFGFVTTAFPQAASQGTGSLSLANFDTTTAVVTGNTVFDFIESFGGDTLNALPTIVAGGSLSPQGGNTSNSNNGMSVIMQVSTVGFQDIIVSWAQRGTSTGFASRVFAYSTDGTNYTTFATDTGALTSTWALESYNLSAINAIEGGSSVFFRITLSGATGTAGTGNNRFDNLLISGTPSGGGGDTTPPNAITFAPMDGTANVPTTATPSITFNEPIQKGAGDILIKDSGGTIFETIAVTSPQVAVSTNTVTITPSAGFANSTGYYIEIPAGAIEDIAGNDYAGISGAAAWNFSTLDATASPVATETFTTQTRVTPAGSSSTAEYYAEGNGQGTFAVYGFGTFNFSKLDFGLSGASTITYVTTAEFKLTHNDRTFSAGTELEFFLTTDSSTGKSFNATYVNGIDNAQYAFAPISLGKFPYTPSAGGVQNTFTLDLSAAGPALISRLNTGEDFSIILAATTPAAAITYSGIGNTFDPGDPSLKLTVTETTGVDSAPPTVAFFTPADGSGGLPISSNIKVSFNELIQKGTGDITILRSGDNSVFETIPVSGSNVTVNLGTVTIDPVAPLESAGNYYVQIAAGAIEDVSGNDFAGIADTSTWNFSTAQPPITVVGPFSISRNAAAGTVVGDLNPAVIGTEGIKYAMLAGSGGSTLMKGVPGAGYLVNPIFTIGDTIKGSTGALNASSAGDFSPVGVPDGLGAFALNANTIRVFMSHEIEIPVNTGLAGYAYTLANGTVISKGGARITYFDIDKTSRKVIDGGLAIARVYDRNGTVVSGTNQLDLGGFDRLCSASLYEPNLFGLDRGLVDRIFFAGEETATGFDHPHGGTEWALDTSNGDLWALPDFGRGSWENVAQVDTGTTTHVAFLLGDDTQACPLYLYIGRKNPVGNFIERNGLKGGQLYVWKATNGDLTPQQFNGHAAVRAGTWVAIDAKNAAAAGTAGHDAGGYKNDVTLESEADSLGAFSFSRPEDLSTSPTDGTLVAFNSTGRGNIFPADNWGDTYLIDLDFSNLTAPTASIKILYDSDDSYNKGGNTYTQPENALRCQDNLDWADDGFLYIQEDQANQTGSFGLTGQETSIWKMDPVTGQITRIARTDRSTVLPLGSSDGNVGDFGNWESSGILDVSTLFGEAAGSLFMFDLQAHSVTNGLIASKTLFQGGQLCFLEKGLETGAFALNPNSGAITLANPDALNPDRTLHELRIQAFDGTNTTLDQITINVTNTAVAKSNSFKAATFNTSLYRETAGTLINDLGSVTNSQAQGIARIIQRNNADVILINEFDYDAGGKALKRFRENYLEVAQTGENPVYYPYAFIAPSNTGIHSGFDLDNNGSVVSTPGAAGYGEDAFGFGTHAGEYAFVVLSKFPIDTANIRTFQKFLWKDMPGALLPDNPNLAGTGDWYSPAELDVFRLSSKNHADVPVLVNGTPVHILASHPTPPVFDSGGAPWIDGVDHNGRRNSDEIRFWSDYVTPANSSYIYDDGETSATASGGLPVNSRFIICGDQNADQDEGDSTPPAILTVINNPLVNGAFVPGGGAGPQPDDTAAFSSGVRVDYCLPSAFGLDVQNGSVFWPGAGDPITAALSATDHHLVYVNLSLNGVELPPSTDLLTYYQPAAGSSGSTLQTALQNIIDNHVIIEYNNLDEIMQVIDASDSNNVRLIYSNAKLPKSAYNGSNNAISWNREHTWPRSDGVGEEGPDFSDLHHLFPCQVNVNSLRSNFPFDNGSSAGTSDPFAPESSLDGSSWEPLDRDKGIIARAQLYMMTRYDGSDALTTDLMLANNTASVGTHGVLSTLLEWNRMFPPTDYEKARNNAIYAGVTVGAVTYAQGNRNPFIDFPQFADAMLLDADTNSFEKWQFENFTFAQLLTPSISAAGADADGDGRNNRAEFLMNGNPLSGTDAPLTAARNENQITLTFHRPKGVVTEQAAIQSCTSLEAADWQTVPNWQTSATFASLGDYERIEYTAPIDTIVDPHRFWRVIYQ